MKASVSRLVLAAMLVCVASSMAFAQGSTKGTISGVVTDSSGGVIPGATVVVKDPGTGVTTTVVSNSAGQFTVPSLDSGTYEVTVTLSGFKTQKYDNVKLNPGATATLAVKLEIGVMTETKQVVATTDVVDTASTKVEATITADQINNLPLVTKNALNFVTFLPGVNSGSTHSQRSSTVLGLPQSTIAITIDGVNVQDQGLHSTDGFFAVIRPQTDLVEEVTVSEATPGADSSAGGAVQIKFVTRSGSNQPNGSAYEYLRHPALNTNAFFNTAAGGTTTVELPKNQVKLNQYGFRQGGPIVLPHLYDGHGKAFYFFNYEELRLPSQVTSTRTVLNPADLNGTFQYGCSAAGCKSQVNVLQVAAANGQITTLDPIMLSNLNEVQLETANCPVCLAGKRFNTDTNTFLYTWQPSSIRVEHLPGGRADFNLSTKERLSVTYEFQKVNSNPDTLNSRQSAFPGGVVHGAQYSFRNSGSATLRSTLGANLVNEASWGFQWAPVHFFGDMNAGLYTSAFPLGIPFNIGSASISGNTPTALTINQNVQARNGSDWTIHDTVSWLKGAHSLSMGFNFQQTTLWNESYNVVPSLSIGVQSPQDPAANMFTTVNFPGASATELSGATNLYALLTGRVTAINQVAALQGDGTYSYGGIPFEHIRQNEYGMFLQDQYRFRPNVTINAGLRYEVQKPIYPLSSVYAQNNVNDMCGQSGFGPSAANAVNAVGSGINCQFGVPGINPANGGVVPVYEQYTAGTPGYNTDYNNLAPSVGVAWQPNVQHGWLRNILGDPALATVRGSYARSYNQGGLFDYTNVMENGPGLTVTTNRNTALNNWVVPSILTPSFNAGIMGPPPVCAAGQNVGCIPTGATYPQPIQFTPAGVFLFDPAFQTSYTDSYSIGFQRSINKDTAIEVRYIGTRNHNGLNTEEWNERDVFNASFAQSQNFITEFQNAQKNLAINIANGKGATYAFNNLAGENPLPIMLASFNGKTGCGTSDGTCPGALNPANYVAGNNATNPWTNTGLVQALSQITPSLGTFTSTSTTGSGALFANSTLRNNGIAAGMPINFWVMNPDVNFDTVQTSHLYTKYNSLQVILNRRLSRGLQVSANYVYQLQYQSVSDSIGGGNGFSMFSPYHLIRTTTSIPNAFKFTTTWDIPVGRGKRYGTDMNKWVDGVLGNWNVAMTGRVENGRLFDIGDVQLHGLTLSDLQSEFKYYRNPADGFWYDLPQALIANTIKAFSSDATTASGYQTCNGNNALTCGGPDPNQPYIAPPNSANCFVVRQGDCSAARDQFIVSPIFTRFDFTAKKRFPFARHGSFDVEIDILNVFNAIDFNAVTGFSNSLGNYQVTSAYSDVNNTFDPGGRIGQLVFRVNW